jgi:hypothetical protein
MVSSPVLTVEQPRIMTLYTPASSRKGRTLDEDPPATR